MDDLINRDEYFRALMNYKEHNNLRGDSIKSGRISIDGRLGNWTGVQNIILECLPLALHYEQSASTWKLIMHLVRNILGKTRNGNGNPKTRVTYKPRHIMRKSLIDAPTSFYNSFKTLKEKNIIYQDEDDKFIYLNLFPSTWSIDNQSDREEIKKIVDTEIGRIYKKINE